MALETFDSSIGGFHTCQNSECCACVNQSYSSRTAKELSSYGLLNESEVG